MASLKKKIIPFPGHQLKTESDLNQDSLSDKQLLAKIAEGNEAAFRQLLLRYQDRIYRFAFRFLANDEDARDIAQETFLRFYKHIENYQSLESASAVLFRIAKNCCIDLKRKSHTENLAGELTLVDTRNALQLLKDKEQKQQMDEAIQLLPDNQKVAILLRHSEDLSYVEIADVMEVSLSAVESLLFRGRMRLKELMSGHHSSNE